MYKIHLSIWLVNTYCICVFLGTQVNQIKKHLFMGKLHSSFFKCFFLAETATVCIVMWSITYSYCLQETTFIEQIVEDESQMEGIPYGCSTIMNWRLHLEAKDLVYPKGWQVSRNSDAGVRLTWSSFFLSPSQGNSTWIITAICLLMVVASFNG